MKFSEQKKAAKEFAEYWKDKGYEKGESQSFWLSLLSKVYGVAEPEKFIRFEEQVKMDHTSYIDGHIITTHVLIEQKSIDVDLRSKIKQSDGTELTPYQQAKRYSMELRYSERPRWIVTCNFKSFLIYDMENPNGEPEELYLCDLEKEFSRLDFLVSSTSEHVKKEMEVSLKAGELVGVLYNAFSKEYHDITKEESQKSLNELCVRLVFCLYAEDSGLFKKNAFHDYLSQFNDLIQMRKALIELFDILDTPINNRDEYLEDSLKQFPYVNGGLFANKNIEIPKFNEEIKDTLLQKAADDFDWSMISPTIFGAVFESTLNPATRRKGGMHYTSIENIHKVIDPLFLNDLSNEIFEIEESYNNAIHELRERLKINRKAKIPKSITDSIVEKVSAFKAKLSNLKFLDPACGSGNFLTETYLSLRRLENRAIKLQNALYSDGGLEQSTLEFDDENSIISVSIQQFYGIEINDFAVKVAKTALWIAEAQMYIETNNIIQNARDMEDFLPLEKYENIIEGNALEIDWNDVLCSDKCDYIMGNPPFSGGMYMSDIQKREIKSLFPDLTGAGELDYVCGWYEKAAKYMDNNKIKCSFVSTNSLCQGLHVITFWKRMIQRYHININFAYRTFVWQSEATEEAKVHCIIIGMSKNNEDEKYIYDNGNKIASSNINPYLIDMPNYFIESRGKPLSNMTPEIRFGSMPRDGGGFILSEEERNILINKEPLSKKWIKEYVGADEFLNNKKRYCLWLVEAQPNELSKCPRVMERINSVREFRLNSKAEGTRNYAKTPSLFCQIAQPDTNYLIIPKTSSGKRKYIPIGFSTPEIIASDLVFLVPNAGIYEFGMLTSNVHNIWMKLVAGRLKSDYRYSKDIVYNNFPWPTVDDKQKQKIQETGKAILEAREMYPEASLSDLYNPIIMPLELINAHIANDKAVMEAYGISKDADDMDILSKLFELYAKNE